MLANYTVCKRDVLTHVILNDLRASLLVLALLLCSTLTVLVGILLLVQ